MFCVGSKFFFIHFDIITKKDQRARRPSDSINLNIHPHPYYGKVISVDNLDAVIESNYNMLTHLQKYGWNSILEIEFKNLLTEKPELIPGRVISVHRTQYEIMSESGMIIGEITGNRLKDEDNDSQLESNLDTTTKNLTFNAFKLF